MTMRSMDPSSLQRLGIVMEPDPTDPREAEGVLNPAVTRGPDGQLYLLPRLVAAGNFSRIGLARVIHDRQGTPISVQRLGVVLEPQEPYELNAHSGGGVEDPRVTYLPHEDLYVMTYTAFGVTGPRIATAVSRDLQHWQRRGLVGFAPLHGVDLNTMDNKDALLFPTPVPAPDGRAALALIHRPTFPSALVPSGLRERRPSMWLSYAPLDLLSAGGPLIFGQHHVLAAPEQGWERLKVGGGTPPLRVGDAWLVFYHGVAGRRAPGDTRPRLRYSAGLLVLKAQDPRRVLYRSPQCLLAPQTAAERVGVVPRVVFPTGLDAGANGVVDLYYGMADSRIGVARTQLTHLLASVQTRDATQDTPIPGATARVA